jgi:phosphopantetheinyl transferase
MPIIFQHSTTEGPPLAVWKIEEPLDFFETTVPVASHIPHPQVRLRHVAARYLLNELRPGFPYHQLQIADSGKPYLPGEALHFSLTHCGDFAAAIVSEKGSVGVDLEAIGDRIFRIRHKFLSDQEQSLIQTITGLSDLQEGDLASQWLTRAWSAKESVYKWQGKAGIDFIRDIQIEHVDLATQELQINFTPAESLLRVNYHSLEGLELTWLSH